ncbi:Spermatogenesis-associated protein 7 [Nymphon striatum]|nr:Spermatogenesis-associated protein 7 [Nymphon striatum]
MDVKNKNVIIKSSVYQPVGSTLFGQLVTEQHMNNHYRLINNAKSTLDNKTPKSFKNEVKSMHFLIYFKSKSVLGILSMIQLFNTGKKTSNYSRSSRPSSRLSQLSSVRSSCGTNYFSHDDDIVRNAMCIKDRNRKCDPLNGLKISDKVALYVDIMQPKIEEHDKYFVNQNYRCAPSSIASSSFRNNAKKNVDLLDSDVFTKPVEAFVPRINADKKAHSKLSQYRCYNPPVKRNILKKVKRENQCNESLVGANNESLKHKKWLNEQAKKAIARQRVFKNTPDPTPDSAYNDSFKTSHDELNSIDSNEGRNSHTHWSDKNEELHYLDFVFEVTEDIISRGIFTNRVLKQVLKSRILKRKDDLDEAKMNVLMNQLREDLGIPSGDDQDELKAGLGSTSDVLNQQTGILDMFSFNDLESKSSSEHKYSKNKFCDSQVNELFESSEHFEDQCDTLKKLESLSLNSEGESSIKSECSDNFINFNSQHNFPAKSQKHHDLNIRTDESSANSIKNSPIKVKNELTSADTEKSQCSQNSIDELSSGSIHKKSDKSSASEKNSQSCSSVSDDDSQILSETNDYSNDCEYSGDESFESDAEIS